MLQAAPGARLLIVGQAPGTRVHQTGIPWNDASGDRLRQGLALDRETFYDPARAAVSGLWPLPHPSWRNTAWLKRNPWFESTVVPALQAAVLACLDHPGPVRAEGSS